jgi:DnaJ-domain-containing protein 1
MMEMLVEVYFPTTRAALRDLWTARGKLNDLTHRIKLAYQTDGHVTHPEFKQEFREACATVNEALKTLKSAIVAAARKTAGVKQG